LAASQRQKLFDNGTTRKIKVGHTGMLMLFYPFVAMSNKSGGAQDKKGNPWQTSFTNGLYQMGFR